MKLPRQVHPLQIFAPDLSHWAASGNGVPYVHERTADKAGPEVLITALVHGNEYSGALALDSFLRSGMHPRLGRITAVFCNMAAFARFDPQCPDRARYVDEDLNRVWSSDRLDGSERSTELARAREMRPFVARATHLLDLHSMHEPCAPLLVTGTLPRNIAFAQSLASGCQVMVDEGHSDGVRMRDYGHFAGPSESRIALLLEAGQHWELSSVQASRNVMMRFLLQAGLLERNDLPFGWLLPDAPAPEPVQVTHRVVARSMSFEFTQDFRGGETIRQAGTVIARDAGESVTTPYDNCVLVMPSVRQLKPGVTTVRLGWRVHADVE